MSKESRGIEKLNPNEEVGKKRKIVFWSLLATGIGAIIIVVVLLLVFLLPKEDKFEIDLGSNVSVEDGTLIGEGSYKKGDSVTIVAEDIEDYRFTGWSFNGNIISTEKEYTIVIGEDTEGEYTANYAKIYSVSTFDNDNYGSFIVAPTEAIAGETVTVRYEVNSENQDKYQLKRLYYVVAGDLQGTQTTIENNTFTMPEGNVTIYAEFNNLYNINLTTNIDEEVDLTGEGTYIENETVTISAPNVAGYRFRNWTYNDAMVTTDQEYTITGIGSATSGTYIANYDRLYSITTNSTNGTVTIAENKTEAIENESVSFTVQPNADYRLIEVKVNDETVVAQEGTYSFNMPAENVTIDVTYSQLFDISVSSDHGKVTITDNKTEAIENESVSFTVQPNADYRLIEVKVNNITLQAQDGKYTFAMPAENVTIDVTYSQLFDISVTSEHGTVTITDNKTEAIANENVSFTVQAESGYRIESVSINNGDVTYTNEDNTYSFTMPAENVTIVVKYIQQLEVILESNIELADPSAMSGGGIEDINTTINLIIPLNLLGSDGNMYKLKGLKFNDNESIISIDESGIYTFTLSQETAGTYTAIYERAYQIDVEQNSNIKVAIDEDKMMAVEGEDVSFTVEVDPGYRLLSVEANQITLEEKDGKYSFKMPAEDVSIKVTIAQVYNITVNQNANASIQVDKTQAIKDESVEITVQANSGYRITGVYYTLNSEKQEITLSGDKYILTMPEGNVEISVEVVGQYQITLNSNIDSEVPDIALEGAGLYDDGASVTIKAPNVAGYRFRNWTYNDAMVTTDQEYTITGIGSATSGTYIANYDRLYSITTNSTNGTVAIVDNKTNAIENENIEFTVEPDADYRLIEVKVNDDTVVAQEGTYSFNMPAGDATISVTYSELFDIKVSSDHGTVIITDNKTEAIANESVSFTVQPDADYRLIEVKVNDDTVVAQEGTYSFNMPAGDVTISVNYDREYAITVDSNSSAYVQIDKQNAIAGESVEFTVSERTGYRITEVKYNNTTLQSDSNTYSFDMPAGDVTISVTYAIEYAITVDSNSSAYVQIDKQNAIAGESVEFTVSDREGYRITEVKYNETTLQSGSNTYSFNMPAGDVTISVTYAREYAVAIDSSASGKVTGVNVSTAINGEQIIVSANIQDSVEDNTVTLEGLYYIESGSEDRVPINQIDGQYSFTMPANNVTIYAESQTYRRLDDFTFSRNSITDYTGSASQLTLPAYYDRVTVNSQNYKIEKDTGTQITSIEWKAFTGCRSLTSITIPEGVTSIGYGVFESCTSLTSVTLPNSLTSIGNSAFSDCSSLTEITIPEGVTSIGNYAFFDCTSLTSITIPEGVTSIGDDTFTGCRSLTSITIPKGVTSIGERAFQSCSSLTSITLPNSLTSIGGAAFTGCTSLTSITLPNSLTSIGGDAFYNCRSLTSITLPNSLTSIGGSAFNGCYALAIVYNNSSLGISAGATAYGGVAQYAKEVVKNGGTAKGRIETAGNVQYYINSTTGNYIALAPSIGRGEITSITLAEGTTEINQYAFFDCSSLTSITLPNSLTSIGGSAFNGCYALAIVYNNSNLEIVAGSSFNGGVARYAHEVVKNGGVAQGRFEVSNNVNYYINDVTNEKVAIYVVDKDVTSVTLAEDTTEIQAGAFSSCTSLTSITIPEGVTSIGGYTFQNCTSLTEITIPEGVTRIGLYAFEHCSSLTSITLPNSLTSIGSHAFYDCTSLTSITIPKGVTSIESSAFYRCTSLTEITIESGDIYRAAVGTSYNHAGNLLQKATTVRVLTTIVNTYDNGYLENTSNFSTSKDGEYTVFTKVQG